MQLIFNLFNVILLFILIIIRCIKLWTDCGIMAEQKIYSCLNSGCRKSFKWASQLSRHKKECVYPAKEKSETYKIVKGRYTCRSCSSSYAHRPNIIRHLRNCNNTPKITEHYRCRTCMKVFAYKCKLKRHESTHTNNNTCHICHRTFRRRDHLAKHEPKCTGLIVENNYSNNELISLNNDKDDFVPSFLNSTGDQDGFNRPSIRFENDDSDNSISLEDKENSIPCDKNVSTSFGQLNDPAFEREADIDDTFHQLSDIPTLNENNELESSMIEKVADKAKSKKYSDRHEYRLYHEKSKKLESIVLNLSSPKKRKLITTVSKKQYDTVLSDSLISFLKDLYVKRKFSKFYELLHGIISACVNDDNFMFWLAKQFCAKHRHFQFIIQFKKWTNNNFVELRGNKSLSFEVQQCVYDTWLENCINSTDNRNGRVMINISQKQYKSKFGSLENKYIEIVKITSKRKKNILSANRMVVTCTLRGLQEKLLAKGHKLSLGKIHSLRPFFVTYPSDKEMTLCMCKICLNIRMVFDALFKKAKSDGEDIENSITNFFMPNVNCPRSPNSYFMWKCASGNCNNCNNAPVKTLLCENSDEDVQVSQFETTETPYKKQTKRVRKKRRYQKNARR